ncbi:MAG: ATP-binding protein, partial [Gammaproteobacteria bacterium]|nr:ATP-binding protein [Gammaproteobacteria bacterium]
DVDLENGSAILNDGHTEHSALVIGYAFKENEKTLAIIATHNQYVAIEIRSLFLSSIQLQSPRKPETFFKDKNKCWKNIIDESNLSDKKIKIKHALPPDIDAVSFRGKLIFYNCSHLLTNKISHLNKELIQFNEQKTQITSFASSANALFLKKGPLNYLSLEILVHFLETLHTGNKHFSVATLQRYAQEFNFAEDILHVCLKENQTEISGAFKDDILKQNPETKRSIVEITSNALDSQASTVRVHINEGEYRVLDNGVGMTAYDIFNHLLISNISHKNGLSETIGRFGIGFYTSLIHLKNEKDSVTVKTRSKQDKLGYILNFRLYDSQIAINIRASKKISLGTEVIIQSNDIKKNKYEKYLKKHFPYTENQSLIINNKIKKLNKSYQCIITKHAKLFYKPRKKQTKSSLKLLIANTLINDYIYRNENQHLKIIWHLPHQTKITESRDTVQIDSSFMIIVIKELIDSTLKFPVEYQISYLNTITPVIVDLQKRNASKEATDNLMHYLSDMLIKVVKDKKCIPDEIDYNFLKQDNTIIVNRHIIPTNWIEKLGSRIAEWNSNTISAYAIDMNSNKHIFYDAHHYILFLSTTFLSKARKNNCFSDLQQLVDLMEIKGKFSPIKIQTEIMTPHINQYTQFTKPPYHDWYHHHGGLYHIDKTLLEKIPDTDKEIILQARTLVARYPQLSISNLDKHLPNGLYATRYKKETYLNQDYYIGYSNDSWQLAVYDQHFQPIHGEKGDFLSAWFRQPRYFDNQCTNEKEAKKLILKESKSSSRLIDLTTQKTLM